MWTLGSAHSCGQDSLSSRPGFSAASAGTYRTFVSTAAFRHSGRHGCSDHSPRCYLRYKSASVYSCMKTCAFSKLHCSAQAVIKYCTMAHDRNTQTKRFITRDFCVSGPLKSLSRLLTCYCTCRACSQPVRLQGAQPPFSRCSSLRRGQSVPRAIRGEPEQQQRLPSHQQQHRSSTWASTLRTVLGAGLLLAVGILGASKPAGAATSRYRNQSWRSGVALMNASKRAGQQLAILTGALLLQARLGPA